MTRQEEIINTIRVLKGEVVVLTKRVKSAGTGSLITAIDVINRRIDELIEEVTCPYWKDEDGDIGRLPGQTKASHLRSVEDAFEVHTEAMEQSRLRAIQNKAAGRKPNKVRDAYLWSANKEGHWSPDENIEEKHTPDDVEHTKEYYTGKDRNRNAMSTADAESLGD